MNFTNHYAPELEPEDSEEVKKIELDGKMLLNRIVHLNVYKHLCKLPLYKYRVVHISK